jgi:hypothetical protein
MWECADYKLLQFAANESKKKGIVKHTKAPIDSSQSKTGGGSSYSRGRKHGYSGGPASGTDNLRSSSGPSRGNSNPRGRGSVRSGGLSASRGNSNPTGRGRGRGDESMRPRSGMMPSRGGRGGNGRR